MWYSSDGWRVIHRHDRHFLDDRFLEQAIGDGEGDVPFSYTIRERPVDDVASDRRVRAIIGEDQFSRFIIRIGEVGR